MLNNTKHKLIYDKKLTVAYFGGSITEGAGASNESKCYRALTTKWLKEKYPEAEITEVNAAIGGTGTSLGMFRCDRDVLQHKPDLIFVEFAINDEGDDYKNVAAQTETIFRTIIGCNEDIDIVTVITTGEPIISYMNKGISVASIEAQKDVSSYYNIPIADVGSKLFANLITSTLKLDDLIPDGLHPNNDGHAIYAESLTTHLEEWLSDTTSGTSIIPHYIPEKYHPNASDSACILTFDELSGLKLNGFEIKDGSPNSANGQYTEGMHPGDSFEFSFIGSTAGFYWLGGGVSHDVLVSVDGGEEYTCRSWDHYLRSFERMRAAKFVSNLPYGVHTVKVTVPEIPTGPDHYVRIEAIMVA